MDSSTRVDFLTRGPRIKLVEFTAEEKVEVVLYWLRQLKAFLKYLPDFRPLAERINTGYKPEDRERRTTEKVIRVSQIQHSVVWPERYRRTFGDERNPDRDVKERNLLLAEDGKFLVEEVEYKLKDGFGHKGRGQLEDVLSYRVRFVERSELISLEQEHPFFIKAIQLLRTSMKVAGEDKIRHGRALVARAEEMEAVVIRPLVLSEPV